MQVHQLPDQRGSHQGQHGEAQLCQLRKDMWHSRAHPDILQFHSSPMPHHIWVNSGEAHQQLPSHRHASAGLHVHCLSSDWLGGWPQMGLLFGCLPGPAWYEHVMPADTSHRVMG